MWVTGDPENNKALHWPPAHRNMTSYHDSPWVRLHSRYAKDQAMVHILARPSAHIAVCNSAVWRVINSANGQQGKPGRSETIFPSHFQMSHTARILLLLAPSIGRPDHWMLTPPHLLAPRGYLANVRSLAFHVQRKCGRPSPCCRDTGDTESPRSSLLMKGLCVPLFLLLMFIHVWPRCCINHIPLTEIST